MQQPGEGYLLDPETACTQVGALPQILAVADGTEVRVVGSTPDETTLGRDHEVGGIRIQHVVDKDLARVRTVGVSGVDERDAGFNDALEQSYTAFDRAFTFFSTVCNCIITMKYSTTLPCYTVTPLFATTL